MDNILQILLNPEFIYSIFRVTTPILFAALASVVAENSGASNIALEGIMLFAALFGALASGIFGSLTLGFIAAILGGLIIAILLGYFGLYLKTNIILAGIALNTLASGATVFLMYVILHDKGSTQSIPCLAFPTISIPLIKNIPIIGQILSDHNLLTYVAFIMVFIVWYLLFKTKLGMHIRCVGENPEAAKSVGINVRKIQMTSLIISGILASLGGAFLSMGYMVGFTRGMVSGRGFIALAAASMGVLSPVPTMIASIIFGFADALSNMMAALRIPVEIVKMLPYLVTVFGLVIFAIIRKRNEKRKRILALQRGEK